MTAPSIEMIAESLRNCSLRRRNRARQRSFWAPPPPPPPQPEEEEEEVTVELNSDVALPYYWEQCLDMRTGEIYYVNWKTGTRTTNDPRNPKTYSRAISFYSSSAEENYAAATGDADGEEEEDDYCDTACSSGITSLSSSSSSVSDATSRAATVLVAAGCKTCFMYFMVPKLLAACPNCGGELLHLGRGEDEEDEGEECF